MKKVYILTFHCAFNVGAMLQCYALSHSIKEMGNEVAIIDYRPVKVMNASIEKELNKNLISKVISEIDDTIHLIFRFLKYYPQKEKRFFIIKDGTAKRFAQFMRNYLPLTANTYYSSEALVAFADEDAAYITGSDQVWNPSLSDVPNIYLLDFVKKGTKNSYAASFGKKTVDDVFSKQLAENLPLFHAISVREKSGIKIVKDKANMEAEWVLDPVFLLPKKEWEKIAYCPKTAFPYILLYRMESNSQFTIEIEKLKNANPQLKVLAFDSICDETSVDYYIPQSGPLDFISYILHSEYVLTNSFHGTAFSIILERPAVVVPHTKYNERIRSLMDIIEVNIENGAYRIFPGAYEKTEESRRISIEVLQKICNCDSPDSLLS